MKQNLKHMILSIALAAVFTAPAFAATSHTGGHGTDTHSNASIDPIGELIHESEVNGYTLAYHFMDLRETESASHGTTEMDKPHHLMVYILDKTLQPVLNAKVGFLIKDDQGNTQKAMGMFMSNGFGITADMKQKGGYTITTKAVIGDITVMDRFDYKMQ